MQETCKAGFTLIEILVAVMLIALAATFIVPNLGKLRPKYERQQFITKLNGLTRFGMNSALITGKVHRIQLDTIKRTAQLFVDAHDQQHKNADGFVPVKTTYLSSSFVWEKEFDIKQIFIEGEEQLSKHGASSKASLEVWFYIMPEGLVQEVIINVLDMTGQQGIGRGKEVGLVINPFSGQFKEYDAFQKP